MTTTIRRFLQVGSSALRAAHGVSVRTLDVESVWNEHRLSGLGFRVWPWSNKFPPVSLSPAQPTNATYLRIYLDKVPRTGEQGRSRMTSPGTMTLVELQKLVAESKGEWEHLEFKKTTGELHGGMETLCASSTAWAGKSCSG